MLHVKVLAVIVFFMMVRWSWPRFRFDQLMSLAWKVMLPLGLVNLVVVAVWEEYGGALCRDGRICRLRLCHGDRRLGRAARHAGSSAPRCPRRCTTTIGPAACRPEPTFREPTEETTP